ncbi:hypothetical protein ONS95_012568 [Cadophora gregata]|uniref:uncharacterized protein n=1 Tax=Cadophora gregata TaxID=51156 RepID=UPI0026DBFA33|nr:uncharacterized protein ONS95_012568 [Cadophora gregata]KAK0118269.1 hypothetical protein ONS95_012568 [Cadophora gregata]KAK0123341.1 hypothetical protein ONS96_010334 [Cadophora gregata f. sp. sojae]
MWLGILVLLFVAQKVHQFGYEPYENEFPPRVKYGHVIGIDFGREYVRVGIARGHKFEPIPDEQGRTAIPNYVAFPKAEKNVGPPIAGFESKEQAESNPMNTFYDLRRLLSRNGSDPEVQRAIKELPYKILDDFEPVMVRVGVKNDYIAYGLDELTAMILKKLKDMAERYLNSTLENAVITVPYEFNIQQRNVLIEAAWQAGLNVVRLVDEPTAIATAYHLGSTYCDGKGEKVDCRYIIYEDDGRDAHLSLYEAGSDGGGVLGTIVDDQEKHLKSSRWTSLLDQFSLTRTEPPTIESQEKRIFELVDRLLFVSHKAKEDVDGLIVITSVEEHTSSVQQLLERQYPTSKSIKPNADFTPDQALVYGASMLANDISGPDGEPQVMDKLLLSLGVETKNGSFHRIIQRDSVTPLKKSVTLYLDSYFQSSVYLPLYEGERELAKKNHRLWNMRIDLFYFAYEMRDMQEIWNQEEDDYGGKVKIQLDFEFDANEVLTVYGSKGRDRLRVFKGPIIGKQWRWREVEDIVKEADEAREEDFRVLREGTLVGEGQVEVKDGSS